MNHHLNLREGSRGDQKPLAAVSVDIDGLEDYRRVYGASSEGCPNLIYTRAVPRLLGLFGDYRIRATFFVIGRDLVVPENRPLFWRMLEGGHEIANHTMRHISPFHKLSTPEKEREIVEMHHTAEEVLGYTVQGFRAPGYSVDAEAIRILESNGYRYDSSVHPTFLAPLIRLGVKLVARGRETSTGMGPWLHAFAPIAPYPPDPRQPWRRNSSRPIWEVPVTVVPGIRLPFYGTFTLLTGRTIFDLSLQAIRRSSLPVNYEIHAIELLGLREDGVDPWFLRQPGMRLSLDTKLRLYHHILGRLVEQYEVVPIKELVDGL